MDLVAIINGRVITDSLTIAKTFSKRHDNVLRDIEDLKHLLRFKEMFTEQELPDSYGRKRRVWNMNRDGFTLLAMGFTGKKAMDFKIDYIDAFNEMEAKLLERAKPSYQIDDRVERARKWIEEQLVFEEAQKKAEYFDKIMSSKSCVNVTQIAADYGMSAQAFNKLLHDEGIQYKSGSQWILYGKHKEQGYTDADSYAIEHRDGTTGVRLLTKWTQKGRVFIYDTLKARGIVPVIEREDQLMIDSGRRETYEPSHGREGSSSVPESLYGDDLHHVQTR